MRSFFARLAVLISTAFALVAPHALASHVHRAPTSGQPGGSHKLSQSRRHSSSRHARGQQAIDPDRVTQIQQALVREHYLTGDANGKWDTTTQAAMQKYQADNGWQTKLMPDSRAIKKLGLGPDYSTAINAKTGNFEPPTSASNTPAAHASGFTAASGVKE